MLKLEILKSALRKRTSTNSIRKSEESRKRACETTEKMTQSKIEVEVDQEAEVSIEEKIDHSKVDKKSKEKRK